MQSNGVDLKIMCLIVFSVTCGVAGQCFFKAGMRDLGPQEFGPHVLLHFLKPKIMVGIVCYAVATTSWLVIVSKIPLSLAYPLISISYVAIVLLGRFLFHETVTIYTWAGVAFICFGVGLIGFGNPSRAVPPPTPATTAPANGAGG